MDRRRFLKWSAVAGGGLGLGARPSQLLGQSPSSSSPPRSLDILILGGTRFQGPHFIRYALERGHRVSTFTRGRTEPGIFVELFERVEQLVGDRNDDLEALKGREWDVVVDNSGLEVEWVRDTTELLKDHAGMYLFTSSTGVYYPYLDPPISEEREVLTEDPSDGENGSRAYGVMKARSENLVREAFGDRALCIRPGYIVGPADYSDRFTYWPVRVHRGGEVLVPGKKDDPVQCIDVRDLTEWELHLIENQVGGTFNATGPAHGLTMAEFIYGLRAAIPSDVTWTWIQDYDFLREHSLRFAIPWIMPVDEYEGSQQIDVSRAVAAGLNYRPMAVTTMDTLEWWLHGTSEGRRAEAEFVLTPEREREILAAWKARG